MPAWTCNHAGAFVVYIVAYHLGEGVGPLSERDPAPPEPGPIDKSHGQEAP